MVTGLQPLEFTDCLLDSPEFRDNLNKHEKELEKTSQQIKRIIKEVKDLLTAAKSKFICRILSRCLGLINNFKYQVRLNLFKFITRFRYIHSTTTTSCVILLNDILFH